MPVYKCKCGAKYKIPESAAGRRVRCKKCDHSFTVPKAEPEIVPLALAPLEDTGTYAPQFQPSPDGHSSSPAPIPAEPRAAKGYMQNVLWTFLFPSNIGNLITFLFIWFLSSLVSIVSGSIIALLFSFWFAAYKFALVLSSAAGDEDMPDLRFSRDYLEELFIPALKWFVSMTYAFLPFLIYSSVVGVSQGAVIAPVAVFNSVMALNTGIYIDSIAEGLMWFGLLFWPMSILCVSIGGLETLLRFDLLLLTIMKSLRGYLVTLAILTIAIELEVFLEDFLAPIGAKSFTTEAVIAEIIEVGIVLYFDIVAMLIIGLYYRHFKNKFAWDWG